MAITTLQTGPVFVTDGAPVSSRAGNLGEQMVSELHGRYYEQTYRKNMFAVFNQAAVTTTAALATTFTGLVIGNPYGSGVNCVINKFYCAQFAAGAAAAVGIMTGQSILPITDTLVCRNQMVGQAKGKVVANAGQTISTPVLERVFGSLGSVATTGYGLSSCVAPEMDGSLILPPGFFAASYTTVVTTSALIFGFRWEEVPV